MVLAGCAASVLIFYLCQECAAEIQDTNLQIYFYEIENVWL